MPLANVGVVVKVTPSEELQIVLGKNEYKFVHDDSPFRVRISEVIRENGKVIAVVGPVIDGHERYQGMIATLTTRLDGSNWESDMRSAANFKVGRTVARRVHGFPHFHPEGMRIDGYPFIIRFGRVEAET